MAVEFDSSTDKITFSGISIPIPADISLSLWYNADTAGFGVLNALMSFYPSDNSPTVSLSYGTGAQAGLTFQYIYNPINDFGYWRYTTSTLGAWTHAVITYNNSGTANNPTFYINGGTVAITEDFAPSSTSPSDTFTGLYLSDEFDGQLQDVRIYNRILSAQEIGILASGKHLKSVMNGLVFWAPMWGANAPTFDGLTLTSSHRISDWAGGAQGTPSGSPIGRANTIQSY